MMDAGSEIDYVVTYLEMAARPSYPVPHAPTGQTLALVCAVAPPVDYFLYLYTQVGQDHEWTDWLNRSREEAEAFVSAETMQLHTLMVDGWPGGFFMLDRQLAGVCDLAYFGLVPQAVGRGLGRWFLGTAIHAAWDLPDTAKLTVNTCTLDHPRALGLYQRMGFSPVHRENRRRRLSKPRAAR